MYTQNIRLCIAIGDAVIFKNGSEELSIIHMGQKIFIDFVPNFRPAEILILDLVDETLFETGIIAM